MMLVLEVTTQTGDHYSYGLGGDLFEVLEYIGKFWMRTSLWARVVRGIDTLHAQIDHFVEVKGSPHIKELTRDILRMLDLKPVVVGHTNSGLQFL